MSIKITIKNPNEYTNADLEDFERLVNEGGEVAPNGLRGRIQRAEKLVFIKDGECVAVGAIKNPNEGYKARIFRKAGVAGAEHYHFELGWLYVLEAARGNGYGRDLMRIFVDNLAGRASFATTREDNQAMHHLFEQFGYVRAGNSYESESGDYSLVLYTRS